MKSPKRAARRCHCCGRRLPAVLRAKVGSPLAAAARVKVRCSKAWSERDLALLEELVSSGWAIPQIARRLERTQSAVRSRAQKLNISVKSK